MPQIKVGGNVAYIGWEGKKISVWENIHSNGKDYSRLWTCWFDVAPGVDEDDFVEVSGELSTKIGEYTPKNSTEKKQVVEHHIQNAAIMQHVTKAKQEANASAFEEMPF